jgi:hypothetical protein
MAPKKPSKTFYLTQKQGKQYAKGLTNNVGARRRAYGATLGLAGAAGSFGSHGRVNPLGLAVAGVGAGLYASGKYSQIKARRKMYRDVKKSGHTLQVYGVTPKGKMVNKTFGIKINDQKAHAQAAQHARKQAAGAARARMSRSQAASVAAKARWGRRR